MRRLLRLALPLGILATLVVTSAAYAQVTLTTKTDGPISLELSSPTGSDRQNTDLAFWGNTVVQGDTRGIRIFDISDPTELDLIVDFPCAGAYGDVSIWNNLVFRSVDIPQDAPGCGSTNTAQTVTQGGPGSGTPQNTDVTPGWEGIQIIDISNPAAPAFVAGVATRCGSANHTLVPDLAQNRILLYSSSYPNVALGPNCQRDDGATPALEHPSIDVVAVPLGNPAAAGVETQVSLDLADKNMFFDYMPGYTGVFNNTPGYKGCKDITVNLQLNRAAAACLSEGVLLDISDRENPEIIDRYTNPMIDLCATGVWRGGEAMNCMWNSAQFTLDGKRVIFGSLQSGNTTCSGTSTTSPTSCAIGGFLNVGVDPLYHGRSVTNECDLGGGAGGYRDLPNQGAYWMYDMGDSSWPISSYKINRFERVNSIGCTSSLMNVVPVNGRYVLPAAWQLGGMNVFDWTNFLAPTELAYYDVDAGGTPTADAYNSAEASHAYAAYWYRGRIYVSYDAPKYGVHNPAGSRGLEVFSLDTPWANAAFDLPRLNPQTQEQLLRCSASIVGNPVARRTRSVQVRVRFLGQPVRSARVNLRGPGVRGSKLTGANGNASFSVRPNRATRLTATVPAQVNMLGCAAGKNIRRAR